MSAIVLTCEHATADVPAEIELGIPAEAFTGHHAWDPGALGLALDLAERFGVPLLRGEFTRLVVDLNRAEENPDVIPAESFGLPVPGNVGLDSAERERRFATIHRPYRAAARAAVEAALSQGACLHLSIHSFVPVLRGRPRPVEVGILFDPDRGEEARFAEVLIAGLRARGWDAQANEPYLGTDDGLTTWLRKRYPDPGYAGIEIEANQSLLPGGRLLDLAEDLSLLLGG